MTNVVATAWDGLYLGGQHRSVWPWSDVVSLVMRFARPPAAARDFRVIELGCGMGANVPLFASLGVDYYGIDASATAIHKLRETYATYARNLDVGDFTRTWPFAGAFDLVIDRAAVTHNDMRGVSAAFMQIASRLKPGGILVSVDLFSTAASEAEAGEPGPEKGTRINFADGPLAGTGVAHFFDETELRDLLAGFEILHLHHKIFTTVIPQGGRDLSCWNLVAKRM
jgi:SAM-dependent methyltransferase